MRLARYLKRGLSLPPHVAISRAREVLRAELRGIYRRRRDLLRPTYVSLRTAPQGELLSYLGPVPLDRLGSQTAEIAALAERYLEHRFDLLGSGWVQVRHGMVCRGAEGHRYGSGPEAQADGSGRWLEGRINGPNLRESQRVWSLVDEGYVPIDWHLDFKSGYRWPEAVWYRDVPYGHLPGVDVKVPWELARMQHLSTLALAFSLARDGHPAVRAARVYAQEFRNQVLDFIATNPPRFGVNWRTTMDVAIRAANWLVAYDLFRSRGAEFDPEFEAVFKRSVYEHGEHIASNLEWYPMIRGNHYLANVVGLLFVAAYLARTPQTDVWLAFAVRELVQEVENQFNPDGSNFEASTSYHRLAAEMVVYATALALGLGPDKQVALSSYDYRLWKARPTLQPPPLPVFLDGVSEESWFPGWYVERLERMVEFTVHITKSHGRVAQIGDNDSGRFLKVQPALLAMTVADARMVFANLAGYDELPDEATYLVADDLDHRHVVAAANALFERDDFAAFAGHWLDSEVVRRLAGGKRLSSRHVGGPTAAERARIGSRRDWDRIQEQFAALPEQQRQVLEIPLPGRDARVGLQLYAYPEFGLYVYRSARLYLAVRCGPIGQGGIGGHAHNDQLGIELNVDGRDWILDPGTFLYTALPERRNEYRSVQAHFAPRVAGTEPGRLDLGLFSLGDQARASCLYAHPDGFLGVHWGYGHPVYRSIEIREHMLRIVDQLHGEASLLPLPLPDVSRGLLPDMPPVSLGYGVRLRSTALVGSLPVASPGRTSTSAPAR